MPVYIIHIGPPKAGSKYLQTSLAALSKDLLASGICYPLNLFSAHPQVWHQPLAAKLNEGRSDELERTFDALNDAGHAYVCFSFEGFFALTDAALAYLRELTGSAEVRIVYYCRRWSERIPSLWRQNVKEGFVETFPEYYGRAVRSPATAPDLNPSLVWDRFAKVFGRESLNLISFNNLIANKVDLVEHFLRIFFGWSYASPPAGVFANESPDIFDSEILRSLNAIHLRKVGKTSDTVRIRFLQQREHLDVEYALAAMREDLGEIIVSDGAQVFDIVYAQMQTFRDRMMSPEFGDQMFARAVKKCSYVRQNYLLDVRVIRELHKIYKDIHESPLHR